MTSIFGIWSLTTSLAIAMSSTFSFLLMDLLGKVDHKIKWKDLKWWHWSILIGVLQWFLVVIILGVVSFCEK